MKIRQKIILASLGIGAMLFVFTYSEMDSNHLRFQKEHTRQDKIIKKIVDFMKEEGVNSTDEELTHIARIIYKASRMHNVDYRLMLAIVKVESNFKHNVVSPKGARGLFQVKPSLAKYIARDAGVHWKGDHTLDEPEKNIKIGVYFFSLLLEDFDNLNLALHAYNMGPTKLKKMLSENTRPNRNFSNLVLKEYRRIASILPQP
ncbi:MAG: lytic transglycosylase domain-containing protein [Syntrophorhabdaceae bacterium]|nr:lytic transglycosylase domain-containing protein [Syntrophorhabdaceae bacterium]